MTTCRRGLCLILTLWLVGSRSATAIRTGLPDSSPLWDQDPRKIQKNALRHRVAGDFLVAQKLYWEGYQEASRLGDRLAAVRYLISAGGCQLLAFRYRDALSTFLEARDLAAAIGDRTDFGAIAVNLSSVYLQVWDFNAALRTAEEGLAATSKFERSYSRPYLLLQMGRLHTRLGDGGAEIYFADGIEAARAQANTPLEAQGWDLLGDQQLADQRLDAAERAFLEAFRLRVLFSRHDLGISYGRLGALKLAQGDLDAASRFTERSAEAARRGAPSWPEYLLKEQQGRIRLARGEVGAALADFSSALDATARWQLEILPARSSLTSANIALEQQVFRSFTQLAAEYASRTANPLWAAQAFQALEINRAASLRESVTLAEAWKEKLAPEYWDVLGQLASEETRRFQTTGTGVLAESLRLRLTEMEAQAGVGFRAKKEENFRNQTSLTLFQGGLRDSELFLSFSLGKTESYLWAVSRKSLRLYRLASEEEIARDVQTFREALPVGGPRIARQGQKLYQELFGQLRPQESRKTAWLLSLEGALFDLPFAALVTEQQGGNTVYLVERHSLQTVPGALLLGVSESQSGRRDPARGPILGEVPGEFLGVGDPIYNVADQRWRRPLFFSRPNKTEGQLDRLVGSGREVEASARSWRDASGSATVLQGPAAQRDKFLGLLAGHPAVIHLATHVLEPTDRREQAFVAFGLGTSSTSSTPQPQYLTTSSIAGLRVPGALVVMTGCATGTGDVRAGAGLLGLTRAWLMAGARAVISTAWPVEDSSGEIFSRFYHYLPETSAAEALRRSQVEMVRGGTWRAAPAYWASYQLTGGSRQ
jgi:CHAT domain-containing protein